jgi:hypothetical protein
MGRRLARSSPNHPFFIISCRRLQSGEIKEGNNFGNLCLEPGQGGKTLGYWAKAGNNLITGDDIAFLNTLNLFKPNGWNYPPLSLAS